MATPLEGKLVAIGAGRVVFAPKGRKHPVVGPTSLELIVAADLPVSGLGGAMAEPTDADLRVAHDDWDVVVVSLADYRAQANERARLRQERDAAVSNHAQASQQVQTQGSSIRRMQREAAEGVRTTHALARRIAELEGELRSARDGSEHRRKNLRETHTERNAAINTLVQARGMLASGAGMRMPALDLIEDNLREWRKPRRQRAWFQPGAERVASPHVRDDGEDAGTTIGHGFHRFAVGGYGQFVAPLPLSSEVSLLALAKERAKNAEALYADASARILELDNRLFEAQNAKAMEQGRADALAHALQRIVNTLPEAAPAYRRAVAVLKQYAPPTDSKDAA